VAECGVIGAPDAERGQVVKAIRRAEAGQRAGHRGDWPRLLQEFRRSRRHRALQVPARNRVRRHALPRTETGKLQRFRLRQAIQGEAK
jgi:2-aminobenzoate-CoA ligase